MHMNTVYDKREGQEKAVTIRLETRLFDAIKQQTTDNDRSVSAEIRQALRNYLREAA